MRNIALIDGGPGAYGVVFPDLPGCTTMADTIDIALLHSEAALRDWVNTVEATGGQVPAPRTVEAIRDDPECAAALGDGAAFAAVTLVRATGKPVRANLSLDEGIVSAIDAAAHRRGVTRSAMVEILAREHLGGLA